MLRLLKILVSASLIGILIWNVDWLELQANFSGMDTAIFGLAVVLLCLQYPVSAWKWQRSLLLHEMHLPYGKLLRILCIAFFFNNFLPTAIGGDAYRAFRTMKHANRPAYPISAIVLERLAGILALLFFGYVSAVLLIFNGTLQHERLIEYAVVAATLSVIGMAVLWRMGVHRKVKRKIQGFAKLEPLIASIDVLTRNRQHVGGLIFSSLVFQALAIASIAAVFWALGLPGIIFESGFTAAAAGIAGILPISINGIGVMEGSFVAAAWESGLPYAEAVAVALVLRLFMLASSVVFGVLYAIEPKDSAYIPKK